MGRLLRRDEAVAVGCGDGISRHDCYCNMDVEMCACFAESPGFGSDLVNRMALGDIGLKVWS